MIKKTLFIGLLFCFQYVVAQDAAEAKEALQKVEDSKSGNFKDAFSTVYQFALKNISREENALELNATLFALKKSYNPELVQGDKKSREQIARWRNLQFNAKVNLTESYKFNGFAGGFTYAIINHRDKGFINLAGTDVAEVHDEIEEVMARTNGIVIGRIPNIQNFTNAQRKKLNDEMQEVSKAILTQKVLMGNPQFNNYKAELDKQLAASQYFIQLSNTKSLALNTTDAVISYLDSIKSTYIEDIEKKPLWTIAPLGATDPSGKLTRGSIESIFLAGSKSGEWDIRAKFAYDDTLAVSAPRSFLNAKLGFNKKLLKDTEGKSMFEGKIYAEYNKVFKNPIAGEEEDAFLANADLRLRLTEELWLPITIKYDVENENFLGFLNVTYNFGD